MIDVGRDTVSVEWAAEWSRSAKEDTRGGTAPVATTIDASEHLTTSSG